MLGIFSILLVQVARFALALPSSIATYPLDCISAETLCLSIENCGLALEAHRVSCGMTGSECNSQDLEMCHSALVGLQTSAAFNRSCLCLRSMDPLKYTQCRNVRLKIFYHPCIPIIKDKFYEQYFASPLSPRNASSSSHVASHLPTSLPYHPHHLRHEHHKMTSNLNSSGSYPHSRESATASWPSEGKKSREIMQQSFDVLPTPLDPLYPSDEPPKHSGSHIVREMEVHNNNNDMHAHSNMNEMPAHGNINEQKRSEWLKKEKTCSSAFNRCKRHAACVNLWELYKSKCTVRDYVCLMTDRKGCRDAFDGISWTGLNTCHCDGDHSGHGPECHWIELLTSHNKCIDELKRQGYINGHEDNGNGNINGGGYSVSIPIASHDYDEALNTQGSPEQVTRPAVVPQTRRTSATPGAEMRPESVARTSTTTTTTTRKPRTPRPTASRTQTTTTSTRRVPTSSTSTATPTMPPDAVTMGISPLTQVISYNEVSLGSTHYRIDSTCVLSHAACRWDKTCTWHYSEVEIGCNSEKGLCNRSQCAQALRRFSTYVRKDLQEDITFCTCKTTDIACLRLQKIMFPTCMFSSIDGRLPSCNDVVQDCKKDPACKPWSLHYFRNCKWDADAMRCARGAQECRNSLLQIRGTALESDCYCPKGDDSCQMYQSTMYFRNPCFEEARLSMRPKFTTRKLTTSTSAFTPTSTTTEYYPDLTASSEEFEEDKPPTEDNLGVDEAVTVSYRPDGSEAQKSSRIPIEKTPIGATVPLASTSTSTRGSSSSSSTSSTTTTLKTTTKRPTKKPVSKPPRSSTKKTTTTTTTTTTTSTTTTTTTTTTTPTTTTTTTPTTTTPSIRCRVMNVDGKLVEYQPFTYYRDYQDVDYRCSRYCLCQPDTQTFCNISMFCLPDKGCEPANPIRSKTVDLYGFNSVNFIDNRGRCTCVSGVFICQLPENYTTKSTLEFFPENGMYLGIGYSELETKFLNKTLKPPIEFKLLDKIRDKLQIELNKLQKREINCILDEKFRKYPNYLIYTIRHTNGSIIGTAAAEKICKKPVMALHEKLDKSNLRDNIWLSVVKQAWFQDNLPHSGCSSLRGTSKNVASILLFLPLAVLLHQWCFSVLNISLGDDFHALLVILQTCFIHNPCLIIFVDVLMLLCSFHAFNPVLIGA